MANKWFKYFQFDFFLIWFLYWCLSESSIIRIEYKMSIFCWLGGMSNELKRRRRQQTRHYHTNCLVTTSPQKYFCYHILNMCLNIHSFVPFKYTFQTRDYLMKGCSCQIQYLGKLSESSICYAFYFILDYYYTTLIS